MHSFLVISKDQTKAQEKIAEILVENKIDIFDRNFFSFEKAAGIEEIKKISEKLHLKPFKSDKKALILDLTNGITTQSQNALLKTLEEPPANTIIILQAKTLEEFLPTIISRCKVYEIKIDKEDLPDFSAQVRRLIESGEGQKLEIAQEFGKDKQTALEFVEQATLTVSDMAKKDNSKKYLSLLKNLNEAYGILKSTNVSPRLILENYLLSI